MLGNSASASQLISAICELLRGQDSLNGVLNLLDQPKSIDLVSATSHVMRALDAVNNSISLLSFHHQEIKSSQVIPTTTSVWEGAMHQDHISSCRNDGRISSLSGIRGGRHNGRRKPSRVKFTSVLIDDGYAWRKYGQKPILNAKYPRSYYKCSNNTHCGALKQVQMIDEKPPLYKITYTSHHTCKTSLANPTYMEGGRATSTNSSLLINFASKDKDMEHNSTKSHLPANWQPVKHTHSGNNEAFVLPHYHLHHPASDYFTPDFDLTAEYPLADGPLAPSEMVSTPCYFEESTSMMIESIEEYGDI